MVTRNFKCFLEISRTRTPKLNSRSCTTRGIAPWARAHNKGQLDMGDPRPGVIKVLHIRPSGGLALHQGRLSALGARRHSVLVVQNNTSCEIAVPIGDTTYLAIRTCNIIEESRYCVTCVDRYTHWPDNKHNNGDRGRLSIWNALADYYGSRRLP